MATHRYHQTPHGHGVLSPPHKPTADSDHAKIEAVLRRVGVLLEEILQATNYGEIAIEVKNGAVEISGGVRHRIS